MIKIQQTSIKKIYPLSLKIPEFSPHYAIEKYYERLNNRPHLILQANIDTKAIGFKIGYEIEEGIFYSWVGAVLPDFRKQGVARALANEMEAWLRARSYHTLRMKTHNQFRNMLLFAIGNGFQITDIEQGKQIAKHRILLEKKLILSFE